MKTCSRYKNVYCVDKYIHKLTNNEINKGQPSLTGGSWLLRGLLCLEATRLLISPKPWLCSKRWTEHEQMLNRGISSVNNMVKNKRCKEVWCTMVLARNVISPSFISTLDHTLALRAWTILFTPVDSGKSSGKKHRRVRVNGKGNTSNVVLSLPDVLALPASSAYAVV